MLNSAANPLRLEHHERRVLKSIAENGYDAADLENYERRDTTEMLWRYDRDDSYIWDYLSNKAVRDSKANGNVMKFLTMQPGFKNICSHPEFIRALYLYVVQEIADELTK